MMSASWSVRSTSLRACTILLLRAMSSGEGDSFPLGWLCAIMIPVAFARRAPLMISPMWTCADVTPPCEICLKARALKWLFR